MRPSTSTPPPPPSSDAATVLDFGGGNGELLLRLEEIDPQAQFICYEPVLSMYKEAEQRLAGSRRISLVDTLDNIPPGSLDVILSLEVFEHLPEAESRQALEAIDSLLKPGGMLIIGVPNELFIAAIYKGLFRIFRRYGEYDARFTPVMRCALGRPPLARPQGEISPGKNYHFHHLGFDHRRLKIKLAAMFSFQRRVCSPFSFLGLWASPEIYYVLKKVGKN